MKSNSITMMTGGVMTGTSTIVSDAIPLDQIIAFAIQAVYTGTPVGTIKLQASCDAPERTNQTSNGTSTPMNWTDVIDSPYAVSGAGTFMWNVTTSGYRFVRVVYTNTSGIGVLGALMCAKGV